MTVLDLVRRLVQLPPDMEVVVQRSGQRRRMTVLGVNRLDVCRDKKDEEHAALLLTDWKEER